MMRILLLVLFASVQISTSANNQVANHIVGFSHMMTTRLAECQKEHKIPKKNLNVWKNQWFKTGKPNQKLSVLLACVLEKEGLMVQGEFIKNFTESLMHTTDLNTLENDVLKKAAFSFIDHCRQVADPIDKGHPVTKAQVFFSCINPKLVKHKIFFKLDSEAITLSNYCTKQINVSLSEITIAYKKWHTHKETDTTKLGLFFACWLELHGVMSGNKLDPNKPVARLSKVAGTLGLEHLKRAQQMIKTCKQKAMKAPDDKGLRAMAFYECIHPKIKLTEQDEQDQRMSDCSHEQNSTTEKMLESYDLWRETGKSDRKLDCFVTCMLLEEGEMNEKDFIDSYPETRQSSHRSISTSKQHSYADNFKSCVQKVRAQNIKDICTKGMAFYTCMTKKEEEHKGPKSSTLPTTESTAPGKSTQSAATATLHNNKTTTISATTTTHVTATPTSVISKTSTGTTPSATTKK